jgi:predicted MPP superfamily phosphohydrolase
LTSENTRRYFLQTTAALVTGAVLGFGADIAHDTHHIVVEKIEITLRRLPSVLHGLRIAQLSDFHYDREFDSYVIRAAVRRTNELHPDIVVLTGDYVTKRWSKRRDPASARNAILCGKLLSELQPRLGIFAVLGNHDHHTDAEFVAQALRRYGFQVLRNQSVPVEQNGARLWFAGLDDVISGNENLATTLHGVPDAEPKILLVHEPDYADLVPPGAIDLQLSGHSHGGQIVFPLMGALYLPPLARKYPWGLRRLGTLTLYTNRGVGTITIPARWNAAPEITLFTLRSGEVLV